MIIKEVKAFKVLNSRADFTIGVQVRTNRGRAWASAPSGASVGKHEVKAYFRNIDYAIKFLNSTINKKLKGIEIDEIKDLKKVEELIDINKIGGDPIIALEFAILKELAREREEKLCDVINPKAKKFPKLLSNVVGGGSHAYGGLDIQEILIYSDTDSFTEGAFLNADINHKLKQKLSKIDKHFLGGKTDEGAWTTSLSDTQSLSAVKSVIESTSSNIHMGIDLAASELYKNRQYVWKNYAYKERKKSLSREEQIIIVKDLINKYNLKYVEDPLEEEDFEGFAKFDQSKSNICGDDLTTTNISRIRRAIRNNSINAIIIKPNQIGSILKTLKAIDLAKRAGIKVVVSHRSGSTGDTILSHLAKAVEADFVKIGISGGERIVKINELIKLEQLK